VVFGYFDGSGWTWRTWDNVYFGRRGKGNDELRFVLAALSEPHWYDQARSKSDGLGSGWSADPDVLLELLDVLDQPEEP
jgi:hypothetical protein